MSNTTLLHAIGGVGDDLIERAASTSKTVHKKTVLWFKWAVPVAACLAVVIIGTMTINRLPAVIDDPIADNPVDTTATTSPPESARDNPPVYNPNIGGGGTEVSYRYFPIAEDIYVASQIVGQEAGNDWYVDVYLSKQPEEAIALPALYQMISYFGISKEELVRENENHIGSTNHLDEYVIDALYREEALMMYLLRHPLALYFDGEIYTYYQMRGSITISVFDFMTPDPLDHIPADVKDEYFTIIEERCEADETLRELKENIDAFWQSFETEVFP